MPEHIAGRLAEYVVGKQMPPEGRLFPLCYTTVRNLVAGLGRKLNVKISPHDLRSHSATYASRNGVPLEIIFKVILRHQTGNGAHVEHLAAGRWGYDLLPTLLQQNGIFLRLDNRCYQDYASKLIPRAAG